MVILAFEKKQEMNAAKEEGGDNKIFEGRGNRKKKQMKAKEKNK